MDMDFLLQFAPHIWRFIETGVPRELQGFVIVVLVLLVGAIFLFWHYSHVKVPVKFAAKRFSGRKSNIRKRAETLGFDIEEVEREVPQFGKGGMYSLSREKCSKYTWHQPLGTRERWELLCRPGEYAPSIGVLGWTLAGSPPPAHKRAIDDFVAHTGEPKEFFEIECADRMLSFYWMEKGGLKGLAKLESLIFMFLQES